MTSLSIAWLAGSMNRKTLLLILTSVMGLSGVVVALAPNYLTYMIGRALIGVVIGGFWSMSAATAMRLVPENQVPRAMAAFNGGNALATVIAAPLGSYLGSIIGWRGAFFCLVPAAVTALIWQWMSLPAMKANGRTARSGNVLASFRSRPIALGMTALMLIPFGGWVAAVAALLGLWGMLATAAPVGWWSWIAQAKPNNAEAGGGLMVAVIQLSIALGSTFGGLLFDSSGYQSIFVASAAVLLLTPFLTLLTSRAQAPQAA